MSTEPINDADLVHVDEVPCFNPEKVVIARIRALEAEREALRAEVARKDEALRQIADPRNWEEQDRARSIARAALGPWMPTHQHENGTLAREVVRAQFGVGADGIPVADLADAVTRSLAIPTIGIGAGAATDAQVLVWQDLAGLTPGRPAKFVKQYADLRSVLGGAVQQWAEEVAAGTYPDADHQYS